MLTIPDYVIERPSPVEGRVAIIDGDILLYKGAFACQHNIFDLYYHNSRNSGLIESFDSKLLMDDYVEFYDLAYEVRYEQEIVTEDVDTLSNTISQMIANVVHGSMSEKKEIYLTSHNNFRKYLPSPKPYKAGRPEKPILHQAASSYLKFFQKAIELDGYEADDALAIRATELGDKAIICSIDKDLKQVPGFHYNITTGEIEEVDEDTAWRNLFKQVLTGDTVDNIEGCYGIGPVKANNLISECDTPRDAYYVLLTEFCSTYGDVEGNDRLLQTFDLVYLHRKVGDDWKERFGIRDRKETAST